MNVILTQNVPHLGSLGDEVHVKDGYARNFLLPRGLAIASGSKNARHIEHQRKRLEKIRQDAITAAKGEAEKVAAMEVVVRAKAGPGGKLFGSVTSRDLQAVLAEKGLALDRKSIVLHQLVKNLGSFAATVRLHTDVKVDINFKVEASEIVAAPAAAAEGAAPAAAAPSEGAVPAAGATDEAAAPATEASPPEAPAAKAGA